MEEDLLFIISSHPRRMEWKVVNFIYNLVINDALCTLLKRRAF